MQLTKISISFIQVLLEGPVSAPQRHLAVQWEANSTKHSFVRNIVRSKRRWKRSQWCLWARLTCCRISSTSLVLARRLFSNATVCQVIWSCRVCFSLWRCLIWFFACIYAACNLEKNLQHFHKSRMTKVACVSYQNTNVKWSRYLGMNRVEQTKVRSCSTVQVSTIA